MRCPLIRGVLLVASIVLVAPITPPLLAGENLPPPAFDATRNGASAEAKTTQDAWAKHLKTTVEVQNTIGMTLRLIPPGEYKRGSHETTADLVKAFNGQDWMVANEYPQHTVRITKAFLLGATEVTRGQFRQFVTATGYITDAETDDDGGHGYNESTGTSEQKKGYSWKNTGFDQTDEHPVVNVTWNDAKAFVNWLSRKENKVYRLPTEAEWEYACRAGTSTRYQSGNDPETLATVGNVADGTAKAKFSNFTGIDAKDGYVFTAPAGKYRANGFGLSDMHGNVWEWCSNWYDEKEYAQYLGLAAVDPQGAPSGSLRAYRGGGWTNGPLSVRSASRLGYKPVLRGHFLGFRVAAVPSFQ